MLATQEIISETGQIHALGEVLPRYCAQVPLYLASGLSTSGARPCWTPQDLERLPLITKQDIRRDFPQNFLGPAADLDDLLERGLIELEHTSGTSEERTPLLLPRGWWAEQERRTLQLNPFVRELLRDNADARRATINSPVCSSELCFTGVPSRDERTIGNTLFLSLSRHPFLWGEADLSRMAAEALEWQPQFLDVDPVYGVVFALYCERRGLVLPSLRFILCSYEFLSSVHRRILARVFKVPVFDLYGSTETGHLLMEDGSGRMLPNFRTAFFELLEPDASGIGELVVTTLTNEFMPLVRYRIGDLVERHHEPYRTTYVVHGRVADAFMTRSGERATTRQIDRCFAQITGIAHYQLLERRSGPWLLRFVPDGKGPSPEEISALEERLMDLLELASGLKVQSTDVLLPESSGKFRLGYPA